MTLTEFETGHFGFRFGFLESITAYYRHIISACHLHIIGLSSVSCDVIISLIISFIWQKTPGWLLIVLWKMIYMHSSETCFEWATEDEDRGHLVNLFFFTTVKFYVFSFNNITGFPHVRCKLSYKKLLCLIELLSHQWLDWEIGNKLWEAPICHRGF